MAQEPALEINTAPREATAYENVKPFHLRLLATKLGAFTSAESTAAWHSLQGKQQQVEYVLALLKDWDSKNTNGTNGASHAAPTAVAAIPPSQVPAVRPDATQAAAAAAQAEKPKLGSKRSPVVTAGQAPAQVPTSAPANVDLGAAVLTQLGETRKELAIVNKQLNDLQVHLIALEGTNKNGLEAALVALDKTAKLQMWSLTALLTLAENQLGATPVEIMGSVVNDTNVIEQLVQEAEARAKT